MTQDRAVAEVVDEDAERDESYRPADRTRVLLGGVPRGDVQQRVYGAVGGALLGPPIGNVDPTLAYWTQSGNIVFMTLLGGFNGLKKTIPRAEGVTMDEAGTLYMVSEPNLFYRFEKQK